MKFYFDTERYTVVSKEQIMQEYIADHRIGESIYDRIQNSLVCNGGTLVELPGDFVQVDTAKKSTSKSTPLDAVIAAIGDLDDDSFAYLNDTWMPSEQQRRDAAERSCLIDDVRCSLERCKETPYLFSSTDIAWFDRVLIALRNVGFREE